MTDLDHGTRYAYLKGCRCDICRRGQSERSADYYRRNQSAVSEKHAEWRRAHPEMQAAYGRAYVESHREELHQRTMRYRRENPEKIRAHLKVARALKSGRLVRKPCSECGDKNVHAHHEDYERPLDVRWLCPTHHYARHHQEGK